MDFSPISSVSASSSSSLAFELHSTTPHLHIGLSLRLSLRLSLAFPSVVPCFLLFVCRLGGFVLWLVYCTVPEHLVIKQSPLVVFQYHAYPLHHMYPCIALMTWTSTHGKPCDLFSFMVPLFHCTLNLFLGSLISGQNSTQPSACTNGRNSSQRIKTYRSIYITILFRHD
jgi:hypothetical protein